jgi:CRISPR-associated protein (TIGR02584 family)
MTTTLVAVTGLSPAIVTETIWALATRDGIIPDRVVLITTSSGAELLENCLFTPRDDWADSSVWDCLRKSLNAGPNQLIADSPKVICISDGTKGRALPLDDIRSPAENEAAAEFIFSQVWEVVRDKNRRLHASVAGGRKTMGALLHAAVSLIGREEDRISHVLVSAPYDTLPDFYFPTQPLCPLFDRRTGRAHEASDAEITLAELPFVPLRNRFQELDELPGSFLTLRDQCSEKLKRDAMRPVPIRIDHSNNILEVDEHSQVVRPRALAILHFILNCNEKNEVPPDQTTAAEAFCKSVAKNPGRFGQPQFSTISAEDFRRELNHLRELLKGDDWKPAIRTLKQQPFRLELVPP